MDKKQFENIIEPSAMQMVNNINEIQKQIDPLHQIRNSLDISDMMERHKRISLAFNIEETAREALQQASLISANANNIGTIASSFHQESKDISNVQKSLLNSQKIISKHIDSTSSFPKIGDLAESARLVAQSSNLASQASFIINEKPNVAELLKNSINTMRIPSGMAQQIDLANQFRNLAKSNTIDTLASNQIFNIVDSLRFASKPQTQSILPKGIFPNNQFGDTNIAISKMADALKQYDKFSELTSFQAISKLKNFPFADIAPSGFDSLTEIDNEIDETVLELDSEISKELSSIDDFNELSTKNQKSLINLYQNYYSDTWFNYLAIIIFISTLVGNKDITAVLNLSLFSDQFITITLYFYQRIFEPFIVSYSAAHIYSLNQAKKELKEVKSKSDVRAFTRKNNSSFDRLLFKGFRVAIVDSLELKESPNVSANVIETLGIGTLLQVLDKTNRSWLLVEVEIDGELEQGWVLRRYTTYFK
ncbi:SH3 domain-containing protein [uncultured Psychrobacter sp.]|uniref:SH3 domain-containing protein n=1 Tax=uncultured Psychrobacter sp. TaxID=259303 RepID=UPI0034584CAA